MKSHLKKIFISIIFFSSLSYGQKIVLLNDSSILIKEIFNLELKKIIMKDSFKPYFFKAQESSYFIRNFNKENTFKLKLDSCFPNSICKQLRGLHIELVPVTNWDHIYSDKNDSVIFIKPHRIDDYFFQRDSIFEIKKNKLNSLYSISPLIFKYNVQEKVRIFAIVCSSNYSFYSKNPYEPYGDSGKIIYYERINNKWIEKKILFKWDRNKDY